MPGCVAVLDSQPSAATRAASFCSRQHLNRICTRPGVVPGRLCFMHDRPAGRSSLAEVQIMITSAKPLRQDASARPNEQFLEMLPKIRRRAGRAFRRARPERRAELIQEVIANAYCAFAALVRDGKTDAAYATPLANFAIRQVISGRQVGNKRRLRDVLSIRLFQPLGISVERLDWFDGAEGRMAGSAPRRSARNSSGDCDCPHRRGSMVGFSFAQEPSNCQ